MLINGMRFCDVCNEPIESGARYVTCTVPKDESVLFMALVSEMDDEPGSRTTPEGSLKLDVCLGCKLNMGLSGDLVI
jgi:hypothetical protein